MHPPCFYLCESGVLCRPTCLDELPGDLGQAYTEMSDCLTNVIRAATNDYCHHQLISQLFSCLIVKS